MVSSAFVLFLTCFAVFVLAMVTVGVEERRGNRILLSSLRSRSDGWVEACTNWLRKVARYVVRHVIQLTWYYSLHSFLQAILRVVTSLYDYFEAWFHKNRARAKAIRAERRNRTSLAPSASGMLQSVADHKQSVALTTAQKKRLRTKKLERE